MVGRIGQDFTLTELALRRRFVDRLRFMKRSYLSLLFGIVSLAFAIPGTAADSKSSSTAAEKPKKLVLMATLKGPEAIAEFQKNVQVVQQQRQNLVDLKTSLDKEKDAKKKRELQTQYDALAKKLEENNNLMIKNSGFSLARNYTMDIEANIYLEATDEEAAKVEAAQKAAKK